MGKHKTLILRTCDKDLRAFGEFQWPESGYVEAPDWDPAPKCGNGLHGLKWGEGPGELLNWDPDAKWLVVSVVTEDIVELGNKVKFPNGFVIHCGNQKSATEYIQQRAPRTSVIAGATKIMGDYTTAIVGERGVAVAGSMGLARAGHYGVATAGFTGTAITGCQGISTAGANGIAIAGDDGRAQVTGSGGQVFVGCRGMAKGMRDSVLHISFQNRQGLLCKCMLRIDGLGNQGLENQWYKWDRQGEALQRATDSDVEYYSVPFSQSDIPHS